MDIGLHYSFQIGKEQSNQDIIQNGLEEIAYADKMGFSSVVFAEHHFLEDGWIPRPLMLASAAAAITKNIRVGTNIVILALHHPVAVAEEIALLDVMSGGRAVLGVGLGWIKPEFEGFGVPFKQRAKIYGQSVENVRALLKGEVVNNDGFYSFKGAKITPLPVNPDGIPIWMGALEDPGVRRAARQGDTWVMPPGTPIEKLKEQKKLLTETREELGLPPVKEQPVRREVFVAETDEKAWELFAPGIRHEYGIVYRSLHPTYPKDDTIENLQKWGEGILVVGSPETVANEFRRYEQEIDATEILVRYQLPNISKDAMFECLQGLTEVMEILKD